MKEKKGSFTLNIQTGASSRETGVFKGTTIYRALTEIEDLTFSAPCGGKGKCGKCRVTVLGGRSSPLDASERSFLTDEELSRGVRLACMTEIEEDLQISLPLDPGSALILTGHGGFDGRIDPPVRKEYLEVSPPSLEDQRSDFARIRESLEMPEQQEIEASPAVLRSSTEALRESDFSLTATRSSGRLLRVEPGDTRLSHYGAAVDIGTTTVVVYLLNLESGMVMDLESGLNRQGTSGADVISRIHYAMKNPGGLAELKARITGQLSDMITSLLERNNISPGSLAIITLAANTTMLHLLTGVDPRGIAGAPFIPAFTTAMELPARDLGLEFSRHCRVFLLPGISSYVGADITAGILATGIHGKEAMCLLVDLGTNGEIVLGNREGLLCCATAAGPAFEGAHISCGVGGIEGAVNTFSMNRGILEFTTIGGKSPVGICGSGILDIASILVETGSVDKRGRMLDTESVDNPEARFLLDRKTAIDGIAAIELIPPESTGNHRAVIFTQKDIREVQLAKGAVAGGIETLLSEAGITHDDVAEVFIAGGFGSFLSEQSAHIVGLIPEELAGRVTVAGNTAGQGAIASALSIEEFENCTEITESARYIELSTSDVFMKEYRTNMYFRI